MQIIKDTVQDVMKALQVKQSQNQHEIFRLLKKTLSRQERLHIKCVCLRQGIITVNVDSSVWLYQLNQKRHKLIDTLGVKDIKFRIGDINSDEKEKGNKKS